MDSGEITKFPDLFYTWSQVEVPSMSMYSEKYHLGSKDGVKSGISSWEVNNNPWWLDFPEGTCPDEEKTLYETHKKGKLHVKVNEVRVDGPKFQVAEQLDLRLRFCYYLFVHVNIMNSIEFVFWQLISSLISVSS